MEKVVAELGDRKPETGCDAEEQNCFSNSCGRRVFSRSIQVSFAQNGSGKGSQKNAEDLSESFELEAQIEVKMKHQTCAEGRQ